MVDHSLKKHVIKSICSTLKVANLLVCDLNQYMVKIILHYTFVNDFNGSCIGK